MVKGGGGGTDLGSVSKEDRHRNEFFGTLYMYLHLLRCTIIIAPSFIEFYSNFILCSATYHSQAGGSTRIPNPYHTIMAGCDRAVTVPFNALYIVRVSVGIMILPPSHEWSQATVACRSVGIINSIYSAITGLRTPHHQITRVHSNCVSVQREPLFPHFPSVVTLELL